MKKCAYKTLVWVPRVLCILFIVFIAMFSLDVFSRDREGGDMLLHFLIHNIPTFVLIIFLVLAWWRAWLGTVLFSAMGIGYIWWQWGQQALMAYVILSGSCFLLALLFLLSWVARQRQLGSVGDSI